MADIIDLVDYVNAKKIGNDPHGEWMFRLDVFAPKTEDKSHSGLIISFNDGDRRDVADRLRAYANALEDLASIVRDDAEDMQPSEDGKVLARLKVWESSRVQIWTSSMVETQDQAEWLRLRLDDASGLVKAADEP